MGVRIYPVTQYKVEYGTPFSKDFTDGIINFFYENGSVNKEETEGEMERSIFVEKLAEMKDSELKDALIDMEKDTRTDDTDDKIHECVRFALF